MQHQKMRIRRASPQTWKASPKRQAHKTDQSRNMQFQNKLEDIRRHNAKDENTGASEGRAS